LLEIEVQGALKVKNIFPDAILMFVIPPSMKELKNRLTDRGRESEEQILKRMETAKWEFTKSPLYNHIFINDDLDECVKEVETVMRNESAKRDLVDKLISEQY
ncbi:MAG: guanylate kinase, partial [Clostridia bacterium]|nr:guanylate kinase [Clostridia bacterium]